MKGPSTVFGTAHSYCAMRIRTGAHEVSPKHVRTVQASRSWDGRAVPKLILERQLCDAVEILLSMQNYRRQLISSIFSVKVTLRFEQRAKARKAWQLETSLHHLQSELNPLKNLRRSVLNLVLKVFRSDDLRLRIANGKNTIPHY